MFFLYIITEIKLSQVTIYLFILNTVVFLVPNWQLRLVSPARVTWSASTFVAFWGSKLAVRWLLYSGHFPISKIAACWTLLSRGIQTTQLGYPMSQTNSLNYKCQEQQTNHSFFLIGHYFSPLLPSVDWIPSKTARSRGTQKSSKLKISCLCAVWGTFSLFCR